MPVFKPPYGSKNPNDHVTSPAQHFGYRFLVAFLADGGSGKSYIVKACAEAFGERAPKDVVCHTSEGWKRRGDLTNLTVGRRLDSYAAALTRYEEELKAERKQEAGW